MVRARITKVDVDVFRTMYHVVTSINQPLFDAGFEDQPIDSRVSEHVSLSEAPGQF